MKPDDADHGAEVKPPSEPAKIEIREANQEFDYAEGANFSSDGLTADEVEPPDRSEVVPPRE